ncbi:MAG TPA: ABC transporter ATP-binding protein [Firmicutes bacterium]|nr:ABC transporter ATP-binding protein [Bacillota bacterium]
MIKLFRFLKPYRLFIAAVLVLIFFQSLFELYLPRLMADIVDVGVVQGDTNYILRVGGLMLLVAAIGAVCTILAANLSAKTAMGFGKILRGKVFSQVEELSLSEFSRIGTASLITRTTNDITQVQMLVMVTLRMMVMAPMMLIGGIIMAVSQDAALARIIVLIIPVIVAAVIVVMNKSTPLFRAMQEKLDKVNRVLREGLTGIRVIRAFDRIDYEKRRFNDANLDLTSTAIKVNRIMATAMPLMMVTMNFMAIAIIWFGGLRIDQGTMQVGSLMAFIQYVMHIMFSLIMVSMMFVMIPRASASAVRINEVLDTVPEICDGEAAKSGYATKGHVEFRNATFSYPGAEKPVLHDISFEAKPGEVTAIIGGTGSGKSTLVNLILRFYDVETGSILINGVDIRDMSQEDLRSKIGFVPQKAVLFSGTVADNIRYGKEEATSEEVEWAAEIAQATEFITGMKDGFDSVVAQGGTNLSGGQKQRLSIARALVRRPEIYIFDDSFSALDFKTDARLRAALKRETSESTVIIVAQRVSTVMDADRIIVLDNGEVAGTGTHRDLIKTCNVYREIVMSQLSEEELA